MTVFMGVVNGFPSARKGFFPHTHACIIDRTYLDYTRAKHIF